MTFGEKLAQARKAKGWTQKELGELLGTSYQGVGQWEKGRRSPTLKTIQRIARALDVPPTELYPDRFQSDSAAGHGSAAANFNEALRQYIIHCVEAMDDRKALLELASDVERVMSMLAEEEAKAECDR